MRYSKTVFLGRTNLVLNVIAIMGLPGCSTIGKTYSEIDPEKAKIEVESHNGYLELKDVPTGTSKVIIRSEGAPMPVQVAVNYSDDSCQPFQPVATVVDVGRGVLLPFIARSVAATTRSGGEKEYVALSPEPGQPMQISGYGTWRGQSAGHCGPLTMQFTPLADRAYVAKWHWVGSSECTFEITDDTDPDAPQPIESFAIPACPKFSNVFQWLDRVFHGMALPQ